MISTSLFLSLFAGRIDVCFEYEPDKNEST